MIVEWYSPAEIFFSREQCLWLVSVALNGWPPDPHESGYVGEDKTPSHHAPYEAVCCIAAELEKRLETTGEAGEALIDESQSFYEHYDRVIDYPLLSRPAKRALNYISGNRRRKQTYAEWKAHQKQRDKSVPQRAIVDKF